MIPYDWFLLDAIFRIVSLMIAGYLYILLDYEKGWKDFYFKVLWIILLCLSAISLSPGFGHI